MKCFSVVLSLLVIPLFSFSQSQINDRIDFGVSLGAVFPGKIQAGDHLDFAPDETYDFKNKTTYLLKAKSDYYFNRRFSAGLCLNYVPIKLSDMDNYGFANITIHMVELDATFKYRFWLSDQLALKPGIAFGIRKTFSTESNARELGMCLNAGIEAQYYLSGSLFLLGDLGFFTQPYGGVEGVAYARGGPVCYANLGMGIKIDK